MLLEQITAPAQVDYLDAENQLNRLLTLANLDDRVKADPALVETVETAVAIALTSAYRDSNSDPVAHRFLQRLLYRINRLKLFWYDDLQHYINEGSYYLADLRDRIESVWQEWEIAQIDRQTLKQEEVSQGLQQRVNRDLNPPPTAESIFLENNLSLQGYRLLLAIASLDGLVEASRLSRILGGAANDVQAMLTRILMEEYGGGRLARKHSTFFAQMMLELGLNPQPEAYFDLVPWEVLASINHNFLLTERKRFFLRYNGGLTYFEVIGPAVYRTYMRAAQRLGLSAEAMGYWELHIREDERHGRWMLDEVALPLAQQYPQNAWELLLGYDQEKQMAERAGRAIVQMLKQSESSGFRL